MDNRRFIAKRAAQYFNEGDTVNLGIGIPSACSDYVDPTIAFQTENGMIGVGPVAKKLAICDTYQNAGGINFVPVMGASAFDTAYSFAVIRSGRMAATVLGAFRLLKTVILRTGQAQDVLLVWVVPWIFATVQEKLSLPWNSQPKKANQRS